MRGCTGPIVGLEVPELTVWAVSQMAGWSRDRPRPDRIPRRDGVRDLAVHPAGAPGDLRRRGGQWPARGRPTPGAFRPRCRNHGVTRTGGGRGRLPFTAGRPGRGRHRPGRARPQRGACRRTARSGRRRGSPVRAAPAPAAVRGGGWAGTELLGVHADRIVAPERPRPAPGRAAMDRAVRPRRRRAGTDHPAAR